MGVVCLVVRMGYRRGVAKVRPNKPNVRFKKKLIHQKLHVTCLHLCRLDPCKNKDTIHLQKDKHSPAFKKKLS